ncbi:MAG: DNA ligase D [Gammaproteobacteria bacterium]
MSLRKYHSRRNFKKTLEPSGAAKKTKTKNLLFVIQKHAASHLHYDFRLEMDGVLKSWAVPKGPSLDPKVKRLAVHVEDHPISYGSFEGTIPKGQYGGGAVMLWDTGTWECLNENPRKAYENGDLKFRLNGKKLKGDWKLIKIKNDPKNWLLIKANDKYVNDSTYDITQDKNESVVSHKTIDKIGHDDALLALDAEKSKMPIAISPELATLTTNIPNGDQWLHEVKFDGYRLLSFIEGKKITLRTRNKNDWTEKFPVLKKELGSLGLESAILDGELVAVDDEHHYNFQLLQNAIHDRKTAELRYYVFDILYFNGRDLTALPLIERKKMLKNIIQSGSNVIQYSDHIVGNGKSIFKESCQLKLEGIVSKRVDSLYLQKRGEDWLKIKCGQRQEFIICGYTMPQGKRQFFGSLLLGAYEDGTLVYCGHVGTGFTEASLKELHQQFKRHITDHMPFKKNPPDSKRVTWLEPSIVVEVEFTSWTQDKILRHPSFKGIRKDKQANNVIIEVPTPIKKITETHKAEGYSLSHPAKVLYPENSITKLEIAKFYDAIQEWILPHIIERPLTLVRCPHGYNEPCFYQKHINHTNIPSFFSIDIKQKENNEHYTYIKNINGLISLVQLGALEIHPWPARVDKLENPDLMIFDLDPGPGVEWKAMIAGAKFIRDQLETLGLVSFVKTTGGKGLHIHVPIKRQYTWDEMKAFSRAFVDYIVAEDPERYIGVMTKAKRDGKIFIDYHRNQRGATSIAAYSTRAREGAPVATPITWDELTSRLKSDHFTVKNLLKRLDGLKEDPWKDYFKMHQVLKHLK